MPVEATAFYHRPRYLRSSGQWAVKSEQQTEVVNTESQRQMKPFSGPREKRSLLIVFIACLLPAADSLLTTMLAGHCSLLPRYVIF